MAKKKKKTEIPSKSEHKGLKQYALQFKEFYDQSLKELKKVVWPDRKETVTTGIAVVVVVLVISLFLGIVDFGLAKMVQSILS